MKKKITGADETVELVNGKLVRYAVYQYTLDGLGPFSFQVKKDEDTAEKLKKAMEDKEKILTEAQTE